MPVSLCPERAQIECGSTFESTRANVSSSACQTVPMQDMYFKLCHSKGLEMRFNVDICQIFTPEGFRTRQIYTRWIKYRFSSFHGFCAFFWVFRKHFLCYSPSPLFYPIAVLNNQTEDHKQPLTRIWCGSCWSCLC